MGKNQRNGVKLQEAYKTPRKTTREEKIEEEIPVDNAETVINTAELDKSVSERKS